MSKPRLGSGRIPFQLGISSDVAPLVFLAARIASPNTTGTIQSPARAVIIISTASGGTIQGP